MPTATCDYKLAQNISFGCDMSERGVAKTGYIVNFDDLQRASCGRSGNLITSLSLATGAKGYKIVVPGGTPFNGTQIEANVGANRTKWNKTLAFVILNSGPDVTADIIDKLANGKFVVVLENIYGGTDSHNKFEVYGFEQGLQLTAGTRDVWNEDTDGGWSVTMQETNAPSSGIFLFSESEAATRTLLEGLGA